MDDMKKSLVVCFSRTGHTEAVARQLATRLRADLECITEAQGRDGLLGYLRSALEALLGMHPVIARSLHRPQDYDLIVIGTPVWFWNMSSPVRSYLRRHRTHITQVAVFCTMGGSGGAKVQDDMARLLGRPALARLALKERDIDQGRVANAIERFEHDIRHARPANASTDETRRTA
jgi:flavodoxin